MDIHPELYVEEAENGKTLPVAATIMSRKEKKELCQFLHSVKFPSGYGSNFVRLVSMKELKLNFAMMKSHDCNVLTTSILPVEIKNVLPVKVHETAAAAAPITNAPPPVDTACRALAPPPPPVDIACRTTRNA